MANSVRVREGSVRPRLLEERATYVPRRREREPVPDLLRRGGIEVERASARGGGMSPHKLFRDRADAGRQLAAQLRARRWSSPLVVGLSRGGVPVAYEVARALGAPLDVCVVRKVGAPMEPELGVGAVSEGGALYVDEETARRVGVDEE